MARGEPRGRRRIVYVADTMVQVQMLEGLAADFDVTLLVPTSLGNRATTFWPPRGARIQRVSLRGGRITFPLRAALWLALRRRRFAAAVALDNLVSAAGANLGRTLGGPPVVLQVGRPTLEYLDCAVGEGRAWRVVPRRALARLLVKANERRAGAIGTVSEYVARQCAGRNPRVRAIAWQGIDLDRFTTGSPEDKVEARRALGLPLGGRLVLWRSRLAPEKDPDSFLAAMALLQRQRPDVRAAYMGGEDDEMRTRAAAHGVDILGRNASSPEEIPLWYRAADVCVQTSKREGLGLSTLEALACGTPVVVSDVGGLPETVDGGRCGLLVPPGDAEATAAAIARYLDDPSLVARHAAAGRRMIEERYTPEIAFASWRELIDGAAAPGPSTDGRVLFVDHEVAISGGGERDMIDLARGLVPLGVEVHAAIPGEGPLADALRDVGVVVHPIAMGGSLLRASRWDLARRPWLAARHAGAAAVAALRLARLARRLRVEVVHSHSMKAHFLAVPAARRARVPHVWHMKDILQPGWLHRAFATIASRTAARIVCISHAVARQFDGTRAERKVEVIHCGLRPPAVGEREAAAARLALGAGTAQPLVGLVGHTARWKGHDVFVEAAARLATSDPDVRFAVIAGCTFPENEGDFDASVRARVDELGLSDRLVWFDHVDDVGAAMAGFDLFVHASRLPEPFGRVLVEAMAQGTPVISTTMGAAREIVPPAAGRLIEPGDSALLASTIARLLGNPDKLAAMAEAARAEAARFDISVAADAWIEVYQAVTSSS